MKKQTLITLAVVFTVTSLGFGLINWDTKDEELVAKIDTNVIPESDQNMVTNEFKEFSDFIYDVGPRFGAIKKSKIENITSIESFLEDEVIQNMVTLKSTRLILVKNDEPSNIRFYGKTATLTRPQLDFLQSAHYSTNFGIRIEFEEKDPHSGHTFNSYREPYFTIVPEVQATYSDGKEALKLFLKENCQSELIDVDPELLKPAKLYFTVTKDGTIDNIKLDRESGYPEIDKKMIELITETPGSWIPARNNNGERVDQELVVSFGLMGC